MSSKILFKYILLIIFSFQFSNQQDIFNDEKCEKMGSLLLNHIITKKPLPKDISNSLKLLLFSGSGLNDLGDYYGCNKLSYAKYYTIKVNYNAMPQSFGFCYLKDCNQTYIQKALYNIYDQVKGLTNLPFNKTDIVVSQPSEVLKKEHTTYLIGLIIVVSFLLMMAIIVLVATITDYKILKPFNAIQNIKTIFNVTNENDTYTHLRIFDGIRFFSAGWVILGHVCYLALQLGVRNTIELNYHTKQWYYPFISAAFFSVDVFFYLSGFQFYFSMQKYFNKNIPRVKIIIFSIINRYLRLFPFYAIGIFFFTFVTPFLSDGPNYGNMGILNEGCLSNFWRNLLYINNLHIYSKGNPRDQMCLGTTWYLACDMQFFLGSLLILVIFNNQKLIRHLIFIFLFIASIFSTYYLVYKNDYGYNDLLHYNNSTKFFYEYYVRPEARVIPYLLGIYFCELFLETDLYKKDYLKQDKKEKKSKEEEEIIFEEENNIKDIPEKQPLLYKFNKFIEKSAWFPYVLLLFALTLINVTFWTSNLSNKNKFNTFWSAFNNAFAKIFFVCGLGIIAHLTFLDKFTFIRRCLTFKIQTALSRSTYGIYIVHYYYILLFNFAYDSYYYLNFYDYFCLAVGVFVVAWVTSLIIGLLVESPVIVITKKFLRGEKKSKIDKEEKKEDS